MSAPRRGPTVTPSVLDRLLDDAPENGQREGFLSFDVAHFRRAIARDLEVLLNTRRTDIDIDYIPYPQCKKSLLTFGIPDLSSLSMANPDHRELLRTRLKEAIELFEPRLSELKVEVDLPREQERDMRFRIDAILKIHPSRPPVLFDATLKLGSNAYHVSGG